MSEDLKQVILDTPITVEEVRQAFDALLKESDSEEQAEVAEGYFKKLIGVCSQEETLTMGSVFNILSEPIETPEQQAENSMVIIGLVMLLADAKGLRPELISSGMIRQFLGGDQEPGRG